MPHTADGLKVLVKGLARVKASEVAIERGDGPMVAALLVAGFTIVVISPNQVKEPAVAVRVGQATRTIGSTRSSWLTRCAPTGPGCAR